jgi:Xaa-Pro aminopeptidase
MTGTALQFRRVTQLSTQVLPMRKRCEAINHILKKRLDTILPMVMRETGFDMWLILCWEDHPDPVFKTMMPLDTWTPILQMLIFFDRGDEGVERINLSRTKTHDLFEIPYTVRTYNVQKSDQHWAWLRELVEARDPKRIAINEGEVIWAADGLSARLKENLIDVLPKKYVERLESGEDLCRRWLETLTEDELEIYPHVVSVAHAILREMYSRETIVPGVTTTEDLKWAFWQRCADLSLCIESAFTPRFEIARSDEMREKHGPDDATIRHGDLVYCDVGIRYLRLITDTKQWVYVLREGETDAPEGLKRIMADGNRLQDIYVGEFVQGRTGNEILQAALAKARQAGLNNPRIYSHSCGLLLHEPGPLIGHPFEQEFCVGRGEVELNYNTTFVAELSVDGVVPEWGGQTIRFPLEEEIMFTEEGVKFIDGRQTSFYLI